MGRISSKGINHPSSSSREKIEMNIKVRRGPSPLKSSCCSSWGITTAFKSNTQIFQTNTTASLKNLEIQVGKLASTLQKETKNAFPSDTKKNPKDCMEVQLRSGREMSSSRA